VEQNFQLNTTVTGFQKNGTEISKVLTDKVILIVRIGNCIGSWLPVVSKSLGVDIILHRK
jgi:hypothetical protein